MKHGKWIALAAVVSAMVLTLTCKPPGDTTPPTVVIISPTDGDTLGRTNVVIAVRATDDRGVMKVEFYIDGALRNTELFGNGDTYRYTWYDTSEAVGSRHSIRARAYDGSSNTRDESIAVWIGNGGPTHHNQDIGYDETWSPAVNPHIIDRSLLVYDGATLTIEPGCIIKFAPGSRLWCGVSLDGAILAIGKPDSMIVFTSNSTPAQPGDWCYVGLSDHTVNTTEFSYCTFEYGGGAVDSGEIYLYHTAAAKFDHCTIQKSGDYGVKCDGAATGFAMFTNNADTGNARYPLHIYPREVPTIGTGNIFADNTKQGIEVDDGTGAGGISTSATWPNHHVPYVLISGLDVGDYTSPVLTIAPGCTLSLPSGAMLRVGQSALAPGGLIADGTSGRIVFTSSLGAPAPGSWNGIGFYDGAIAAQCKLVNCKVEYGGGGATLSNIYTYLTTPTITGDSIGHSSGYGIYSDGTTRPDSAGLEAGNSFYDCVRGHVGHP